MGHILTEGQFDAPAESAVVDGLSARLGVALPIAIEFTEAWVASLKEKPCLSAICERLIEYATNDA